GEVEDDEPRARRDVRDGAGELLDAGRVEAAEQRDHGEGVGQVDDRDGAAILKGGLAVEEGVAAGEAVALALKIGGDVQKDSDAAARAGRVQRGGEQGHASGLAVEVAAADAVFEADVGEGP